MPTKKNYASAGGRKTRAHHVIGRAHYRVRIASIFIANGAIDRATFDGRSVNHLIVLDFVKLRRKVRYT